MRSTCTSWNYPTVLNPLLFIYTWSKGWCWMVRCLVLGQITMSVARCWAQTTQSGLKHHVRTIHLCMWTQTMALHNTDLQNVIFYSSLTSQGIHYLIFTELLSPHSWLQHVHIFNLNSQITELRRTNPKKKIQVFCEVLNKIHIC